jgi:hypothetical protein
VLQQNGPEEWVEVDVSGAGSSKAAARSVRRISAVPSQAERPSSVHDTGRGPQEALTGLSTSKLLNGFALNLELEVDTTSC